MAMLVDDLDAVHIRSIEMPFVQLADLRMHYHQAGAGSTAAVLLHGNFASWRWWIPLLDRLPSDMRAYVPDLRGCGQSQLAGSGGDYSIARLAEDVAEFVDAVELKKFHLVGHSLGGAVALELMKNLPDRLRSLTLVAPAPSTGLSGMRAGDSASARNLRNIDPSHPVGARLLHQSLRMGKYLGASRMMLQKSVANMMPTLPRDAPLLADLVADATLLNADTVVGFYQALDNWDVSESLPQMRVPTLIVWGEKDELIPQTSMVGMADTLPHAELIVWPHVGHSPQIEDPEQFLTLWTQAVGRNRHMRRLSLRMRRLWRNAGRIFQRRKARDTAPKSVSGASE